MTANTRQSPQTLSFAWLLVAIFAAEAYIVFKGWQLWQPNFPRMEFLPGFDPQTVSIAVVVSLLVVPIACGHLAWLLTGSRRAMLVGCGVAAVYERLTPLIGHGRADLVLTAGALVAGVWLLALATRRGWWVLAAPAGVVMAGSALYAGPATVIGVGAGAALMIAVCVMSGRQAAVVAVLLAFGLVLGAAMARPVGEGRRLISETPTLEALVAPVAEAEARIQHVWNATAAKTRPTIRRFLTYVSYIWWRIGGLLMLALLVYLTPSWRLASARAMRPIWLAVMLPAATVFSECLFGDSVWYHCAGALVPAVVIPAMIWRTW